MQNLFETLSINELLCMRIFFYGLVLRYSALYGHQQIQSGNIGSSTSEDCFTG
jgi:hypothetical protein